MPSIEYKCFAISQNTYLSDMLPVTHQARVDHIEVISTEEDPGI